MKKLIIFILIFSSISSFAQSKKELQTKIESLEKANSVMLTEMGAISKDVAVMKSELESLKRENDFLKQMVVSGTGKQALQDTTKQALTEQGATPGRCNAITSKGTQCSRTADVGSEYCWQHKKTYEPNSIPSNAVSTPKSSGSSGGNTGSGRTIYTGPRGGKYYINSSGKKTYIKK